MLFRLDIGSNFIKSVMSVMFAVFAANVISVQDVYADAAGRSGRSGAIAGRDCTGCHTAGVAVPRVVFGGNQSVAAGASGTFTFTITGGPGVVAGFDVSASGGTLGVAAGTAGTKISAGEVVQSSATRFSAGSVVYSFTWTAPATAAAGTVYTLYGAGLSGNGDGRDGAGDGTATASYPITISGGANNGGGNTTALTANIAAPTTGTTNQTLNFDGTGSTTPTGTTIAAAGYMWNFGDGTTGVTGSTATYAYTTAGSYTVTLKVTNSAGATSTATSSITITDAATGGGVATVGLPRVGERLYDQFCSECHGPGGVGIVGDGPDVTGSTVTQIEDAIANVVDMQTPELQGLEEDEVKLISSFLRGAKLYNDNCLSCHGASGGGGDAPAILGASASAIAEAIKNVVEMQTPELEALSKKERKLIAFYIPADPAVASANVRARGLGDVPSDYSDILNEVESNATRTTTKKGSLDWLALSVLGMWAIRRRRKR